MAHPVPIQEYTSQVPVEEGLRRIIPNQSGASIGGAISDIGNALTDVARQDGAMQAGSVMAKARADWTQNLIDRQQSYQPGEDFTGKLTQDFGDYQSKAVKDVKNPFAKKFVSQQLGELGSQITQKGMLFQANAQVTNRVTSFQDSASNAEIAVSLDPSQYEKAYGEQLATLNELKIDPDTKAKLATDLRSKLSLAAGKRKGELDPVGTLLALNQPETGDSALNRLNHDERLQVQDHILSVQKLQQQQEEHEQLLANRALKAKSDQTAKEGDDLVLSGKISPAWLHANKDNLEPSEYRYFSRKLSGEDKPAKESDPATFADIFSRAVNGDDVREEARNAFLNGQLKQTDYAKIVGDVMGPREGWYKRGVQYLNEALNPGQLNPDPAASRSKANALADLHDWAQTHPKATDSEAQKQAELLAQHYQVIPQDKTVLGLRAPQFLSGTRLEAVSDDGTILRETAKKTADALQRGEITQDQAEHEAVLWKQYDALRKATTASNAAKKKK